jgi:hypothetical protein
MNASDPRRRQALAALLPMTFCLLFGLAGITPALAEQPQKGLRVYAYTFKHHSAQDALTQVRNKLSPFGTVEEQPATNTLVIRDIPVNVERLIPFLKELDLPPEELRFDIRIIRAGPKAEGAAQTTELELPTEMVNKLRRLLRYDDYRVLAQAGVTSREGEEVTYALGEGYSVSFSPGSLVAGQDQARGRLKLRDFRILKDVPNPSDKGRRLEPRKLFHATLNLWIDRPFNLVLTQDDERQEALMVVISCQREGVTGQ